MRRNNRSNGPPSPAYFSTGMTRRSSNVSNVAGSSEIINIDDDDTADHVPIQSTVLSDSSSSFTFWEDMYRDSMQLEATQPMEDAPIIPTRDIASASGWATDPTNTFIDQTGNQSLLHRRQDFPNFHTNGAEFSGLSLNEESSTSLNNNQSLMTSSYGVASLSSQRLPAQQAGMQHFIPMQNNNMSSVPVARHIPERLGIANHSMEYVPELVGLTRDITIGSGMCDSSLGISMAQIADRSISHPCQDFSTSQRNAARFSGLTQNEGWSTLNDNQWLMTGNYGLTSSPLQNLQTQQVGMQQFIPSRSNNMNPVSGWSGESFSVSNQLGNLWQSQETEPLQQSIDLNKPYFSTGNLRNPQEKMPSQQSIDLNSSAFSTARPCSSGVSNNFLMNDGKTCLRRQVSLASNIGRPQGRENLQPDIDLNVPTSCTGGGQGPRAPNESIHTQSFSVLAGQLQKTGSNQYLPAIAANVRSFLPQSFRAPSPNNGQVTRAANELIDTQSFGVPIGQFQNTNPNQAQPAITITANESSFVPSIFNGSWSSDGPHIPVGNVEQASSAHAGSSHKRKATGPSLMNHSSIQRTKTTHVPSTQPCVSFANQYAASMVSARPPASFANQNAVSVVSAPPPVSFANQNATGVASARPRVSFVTQTAATIASARPHVSLTNQNAENMAFARPPVSFANQNATSVASARPHASFANQNAARIASARPPVSMAIQNAASMAFARPPVSFANQNAVSVASAQPPASFGNQNSTSVGSARPPVSFANQSAARKASAWPHVSLANQNTASMAAARPHVFTNQNAVNVASALPLVSFTNQNATSVVSARPPVSFANQNATRIASAQPTLSLTTQNAATVAFAQPPISFANPDAATIQYTRQRVRTRGPSTRQRVRTRGPSSLLQSSISVPSTPMQSRTTVPSIQQQSSAQPSSTRPQSRGHPSFTPPQSRTPVPFVGPPGIAPMFYIKQEVDPSCRPTGKIQEDCELCHKDLSEQPDGVASPASNEHAPAPMSAILPCGHVFHDYCLKIVTSDQVENPPCIPCSLAEPES